MRTGMASEKPLIVLVPGAWHTPYSYKLVIPLLEDAGYETEAIALASVGETVVTSMQPDIDVIRASLVRAADAGRDIVLVLHSYGGIPGSDAAQGLFKEDRLVEGKQGGVVHIVYLTAFVCHEDEGLLESKQTSVKDPWLNIHDNGQCTTSDTAYYFYNDIHISLAPTYIAEMKAQTTATFLDKAKYAAWKYIPSTYVLCTIDNATPLEIQERMAARDGARFDQVRLRSGHMVMLIMPEETARSIRRAAGEHELEL